MPAVARIVARLALLAGLSGMLVGGARGAEPQVVLLPTTGIVDQVMAAYLREGVAAADARGAEAVIIELNTPGGSLEATNEIAGTLLEARVPVIVWVAPSGGRAASAGTFITLAGHVALMAPGTNIGAASPVGGGGEDIPGTLGEKVLQDAIAKMTSIVEARQGFARRNLEWAVATVRDARSSSAGEAVALGAVDGLAATLDEVLAAADGRAVEVTGRGTVTLDLRGATVSEVTMNPLQGFLHLLSDPNISFILFTVGFYGLIFELSNPNFVTGILGAFAIILAFIGFGSLPLNVAGLLLIGLGIVLFILEFTVTSHGLLTVGGLVAFVLGAAALFGTPNTPFAPAVSIDPLVIGVIAAATGLYMVFIVFFVLRSRRLGEAIRAGDASRVVPVGTVGETRGDLAPTGVVFAAGEEWSARTADRRPVSRGTPVRVLRKEGLTLIVEPLDTAH
jgi:membrane-bound serine protease (ClpP class)